MGHGGVQPDFAHLAAKVFPRVGIHAEMHRLARVNGSDVRFVDRYPDLHALEILGDEEQAGGIQAGHHRLTDVHPAIDDHPFDRGGNGAVAQVALRPLQRCLGLGHRILGLHD